MIELTKEQADAIAQKAIELGLTADDAISAGWLAKIVDDPDAAIKYLNHLWNKKRGAEERSIHV